MEYEREEFSKSWKNMKIIHFPAQIYLQYRELYETLDFY
jgi:exopolysaccharide biosynthesis predicted pyruvyltransferase EpsI